MGSHVDNFIKEVQNKENNNGKSYETARSVRQEYSQREEIVGQVTSSKNTKKKAIAWKLHQVKYHQVTL